jgi:hypothetical protein
MRKYKGTIFMSGNSYAIRLPKDYVEANNLHVGQVIALPDALSPAYGNAAEAMRLMQELVDREGDIQSIPDPVAWQRDLRKSTNPWDDIG